MHVLHVIPTMNSSDGGPTAAVVRMTEALAERGLPLTVATTHSRWARGEDPESIVRRFSERVKVHTFPAWPAVQPRGFSPRMLAWLRRSVEGFDLVHLHSMFNWHSLAVPAVCRAHGVPFILRPLGTLDPWSRDQKSWKKRPYFELVERRNLETAARVHVTSEAELDGVTALGFGGKARRIPIAVDLPPLQARDDRPGRELRILFLSRIHPKKNLPALLQALLEPSFARPPVLTVAGDGDPEYVLQMRELTKRLGLEQRVTFVGFVEREEKRRVYADSDVFALPSFQENFGIAVAEAMAHGLPVVVSADVAIAPDIRAASAGSVVEPSPAELARALALYEDAATCRRASAAARELVVAKFSEAAMAEGLLALYREVVAG